MFVLHATARILVIRVSFRNSPFLICSAHARCELRDSREEAASMAFLLWCIESNAQVGSVVSSFVGGQEPDLGVLPRRPGTHGDGSPGNV